MTQGRCGSLVLHRGGRSPPASCRRNRRFSVRGTTRKVFRVASNLSAIRRARDWLGAGQRHPLKARKFIFLTWLTGSGPRIQTLKKPVNRSVDRCRDGVQEIKAERAGNEHCWWSGLQDWLHPSFNRITLPAIIDKLCGNHHNLSNQITVVTGNRRIEHDLCGIPVPKAA